MSSPVSSWECSPRRDCPGRDPSARPRRGGGAAPTGGFWLCLVRYDNEAGKGDHRHYGDREEPYRFSSIECLLDEFRQECTRLAGWRWQ